jgi:hypothetical protein
VNVSVHQLVQLGTRATVNSPSSRMTESCMRRCGTSVSSESLAARVECCSGIVQIEPRRCETAVTKKIRSVAKAPSHPSSDAVRFRHPKGSLMVFVHIRNRVEPVWRQRLQPERQVILCHISISPTTTIHMVEHRRPPMLGSAPFLECRIQIASSRLHEVHQLCSTFKWWQGVQWAQLCKCDQQPRVNYVQVRLRPESDVFLQSPWPAVASTSTAAAVRRKVSRGGQKIPASHASNNENSSTI